MGAVEHELLGVLLGVTQKSLRGQINLENTGITFVVFIYFPWRIFKLEPLMCLYVLTF